MTTPDIILRDYFAAWIRSDRDCVRSLLHDDLVFRAPDDSFDSADAMLGACWKHADGMTAMDVIHEVYGADAAYIAYKTGDLVVGEYMRLRDGRIAEIYVTFNPTT